MARDELVAVSDMASHELVLHYPAVLARRNELCESLTEFFKTHLQVQALSSSPSVCFLPLCLP